MRQADNSYHAEKIQQQDSSSYCTSRLKYDLINVARNSVCLRHGTKTFFAFRICFGIFEVALSGATQVAGAVI